MNRAAVLALASTMVIVVTVGALALWPMYPVAIPGTDKTHHFLAFAAIVFPIATQKPRWLPAIVILAAAYGAAIEVIHPYVGRYGDVSDWAADLLGILAGAAAGLVANRLFVSRS